MAIKMLLISAFGWQKNKKTLLERHFCGMGGLLLVALLRRKCLKISRFACLFQKKFVPLYRKSKSCALFYGYKP